MKNKMHTSLKLISATALLTMAGSVLWSAVNDPPRPAPSQSTASATVPKQYDILLHRSIFAKDGEAAQPTKPRGPWGPPTSVPSTTPSAAPALVYTAPPPEGDYVLRGVGMQDGVFTAFFERTSLNTGYSASVGQTVARGKITAMSLDGLDYTLNGKSVHIVMGHALDGHEVVDSRSTTTTASGGDWHSKWGKHADTPAATPASPAASEDGGRSRGERDKSRWGAKPGEQGQGGSDRNRGDGQQPGFDRSRADGQQPGSDAQPQPIPDGSRVAEARPEGPGVQSEPHPLQPVQVIPLPPDFGPNPEDFDPN